MNSVQPTYPASAAHPEFGDQEITGEIRVDHQGLLFEHQAGSVGLPFMRLRIERESDGRIRFTDSEQPEWSVFTYGDAILNQYAFKQRNELRSQVLGLRRRQEGRRMVKLTAMFLGSFAAIALVVSLASSVVVNFLLARVPASWETRLGQVAMEELGEQLKVVEEPALSAHLRHLAGQLSRGLPKHDYAFEFRLVDYPWPNAFALPGGTILVTTGLLDAAQTPEEVAAVLAHEMAHVLRRHGLRKIITAVGPYYVMRVFLNDRESFLSVIGAGSQLLVQQSFSRDYEREADEAGWNYLVAARIDPRGLASFLRTTSAKAQEFRGKIGLEDAVPVVLRSHPPDEERLQYLETLWEKSKVKTGFVTLQKPPEVAKPQRKD